MSFPDSAVLSSSAWGLGRVHRLGGVRPGWSSGFAAAEQVFAESFDLLLEQRRRRERLARDLLGRLSELLLGLDGTEVIAELIAEVKELLVPLEDEQRPDRETAPPMDYAMLDAIRRTLLDLTGTSGVLPQREPTIRIKCEVVKARQDDDDLPASSDFLNSFFTGDLTAIGRQVRAGRLLGALEDYLTEPGGAGRIDVRESLDDVYEAVRPGRIPLGRWPASPRHSAALGQQLAINNALHNASMKGEITGVNGPPGTGKTTLLRDMFAALITERARKLAGLARAEDGLGPDHRFSKGGFTLRVPQLRPELCGYEIVVASSNNGAVQNVTAETPHRDEIDERWRDRIDFFTEIGDSVLNAERFHRVEGEWERSWSLIAAVLGNAANRTKFSNAFWFGRKENSRSVARPGMLAHLKTCVPERSWSDAKRRFKAAESKVEAMAAERERHFREWKELETHEAEAKRAQLAMQAAEAALASAERGLGTAVEGRDAAEAEVERTRRIRDDWWRQRPGPLGWLLRNAEWREWRRRSRTYAADATSAWDARLERDDAVRSAEVEAGRQSESLADARTRLREIRAVLARCRVESDRARERFGAAYPNRGADRAARELVAPWCDEEFNAARSELFLEALRLHRAFIEHNRDRFKSGLGVAIDVVNRSVPADLAHEIRLAAWRLLFMAVPIVSTTFASVARQFGGLEEGDLGWLFIDEAGQATPQAAVGAVWRARHVMAVGDPLQLEPVLSLPHTIQQSLREHYGLSDYWVPGKTSVQRLADAHTAFGTDLPGPDDTRLWVGSPLTVHRRCDDPMFSISNRIAYDGLMISDTPARSPLLLPESGKTLVRSMWLDVKSEVSQGHWKPAEGDRLKNLLNHLSGHGFDMGEVLVITPFVEVASRLSGICKPYRVGGSGTVHRAQGKQADIVILVLGGDPAKPRAGSFAAEKPNFVNVAVSRAKRRLFVIGDHATWSRLPNFGDLAAELGDPR